MLQDVLRDVWRNSHGRHCPCFARFSIGIRQVETGVFVSTSFSPNLKHVDPLGEFWGYIGVI